MQRILIQLDTDSHPSTFDRVVAVDAGVYRLFSYGGVTPENVVPLIHGAMFTRGPADLKNTALFIGGSDVAAGEELVKTIESTFFGPLRVSLMMDSNGSNTTAAAAVLAAGRHLPLSGSVAVVLGGAGPVGQRAALLLALEGAKVRVASRSLDRARIACADIMKIADGAELTPCETGSTTELETVCQGVSLIIAAGAAGVTFLSAEQRQAIGSLKVAIDLNAVPPAGLTGINSADKAAERDGTICFGAIGVGGTKMKIHKAALSKLFESNDQLLDIKAIYQIGSEIA
jgi:hypothetical protein